MGVTINQAQARSMLLIAYERAKEDIKLPQEWIDLAEALRAEKAPISYTPALGGALLARACDDGIDPLSIKAKFSDKAFSLRSVCHNVLVPVSVQLRFDLNRTGREPMNNQPFFRYDHYDHIDTDHVASRARPYLARLTQALRDVANYSREEASLALSAFLRVCIEHSNEEVQLIGGSRIVEASLIALTQNFIRSGDDVPKKLQACVAAGLELAHGDIVVRRINDPSRDFPGDVQVRVDKKVVLSVEVRGKPVTKEELEHFVRDAARAGIPRTALVVDSPTHSPLNTSQLSTEFEERFGVLVNIQENMADFLRHVFGWSSVPTVQVLARFPDVLLERMREIGVSATERERWITLFPAEGDSLDQVDATVTVEDGRTTLF